MAARRRKPGEQKTQQVRLPFGVGRAEELPILVIDIRENGYTTTLDFGTEFNAVRDHQAVAAMKAGIIRYPGVITALYANNIDIAPTSQKPLGDHRKIHTAFLELRSIVLEAAHGLELEAASLSPPHDPSAVRALIDAAYHIILYWSCRRADLPPPRPQSRERDNITSLSISARWFTKAAEDEDDWSNYDTQLLWSDVDLLYRVGIAVNVSPYGYEPPHEPPETAEPAPADIPASRTNELECSHSPDFTSVTWFGVRHVFKPGQQTAVVKALWQAWESDNPTIGLHALAEMVDSDATTFRLDHVFRGHIALRTMISTVHRGVYALTEPPIRQADT